MISKIPECWVIRLFLIAPEAFIPMRAGTGQQSVLKHIDGGAELLPQSSVHRRLHRVFSHNRCSFLLMPCAYFIFRSDAVMSLSLLLQTIAGALHLAVQSHLHAT